MTMPLLEGLDGVAKMSKSLGNYIGVTESPSQIYGKTMSIPDSLMMKYYELLSGLTKYEIDKIRDGLKNNLLHPRDVKKRLARIFVATFHNEKAADDAEREFEKVFREGGSPENIPVVNISSKELEPDKNIWLPKAIVLAGGAPSSSEASRIVEQGGVEVNGEIIKDKKARIKIAGEVSLRVGKRKFFKLREKK
jgi:tyrosyl-tRNA synthetase